MSKTIRKKVAAYAEQFGKLRDEFETLKEQYASALEQAESDLEEWKEAEQERYDNMSERGQDGKAGEKCQAMIEKLGELGESVTSVREMFTDDSAVADMVEALEGFADGDE